MQCWILQWIWYTVSCIAVTAKLQRYIHSHTNAHTFEQVHIGVSSWEWSDFPFVSYILTIHSRCTKEANYYRIIYHGHTLQTLMSMQTVLPTACMYVLVSQSVMLAPPPFGRLVWFICTMFCTWIRPTGFTNQMGEWTQTAFIMHIHKHTFQKWIYVYN